MAKGQIELSGEFTESGYEEKAKEITLADLLTMTKEQKLALLDDSLLNTYILQMNKGQLKANDLGAVVTYLKNNKVVAEKPIKKPFADEIKDMVE